MLIEEVRLQRLNHIIGELEAREKPQVQYFERMMKKLEDTYKEKANGLDDEFQKSEDLARAEIARKRADLDRIQLFKRQTKGELKARADDLLRMIDIESQDLNNQRKNIEAEHLDQITQKDESIKACMRLEWTIAQLKKDIKFKRSQFTKELSENNTKLVRALAQLERMTEQRSQLMIQKDLCSSNEKFLSGCMDVENIKLSKKIEEAEELQQNTFAQLEEYNQIRRNLIDDFEEKKSELLDQRAEAEQALKDRKHEFDRITSLLKQLRRQRAAENVFFERLHGHYDLLSKVGGNKVDFSKQILDLVNLKALIDKNKKK